LLEQRIAPATITTHWIGLSGNWTDPAHWDNGVPDNHDGNDYTAIIDVGLLNPVVTIDSDIQITSLTNAEAITVAAGGSAVVGDPAYGFGSLENSAGSITVGAGSFALQFLNTITTAQLGAVHVTGGAFSLETGLDNRGATLLVDAPSGAWLINNATIVGGSIDATAGSKLSLTSIGAHFDGVTLNADLDFSPDGIAGLLVTSGLSLNATVTLGAFSQLNFNGTQTLDGTGSVFFTNSFGSALYVTASFDPAPTLTIESGITIHGGSSSGSIIATAPAQGATHTIINKGTISADVGGQASIMLGDITVVNHGTIEAKNGGTMTVTKLSTSDGTLKATSGSVLSIGGDHWTNTGVLTSVDANVIIDGTVTTAGLGPRSFTGGTVAFAGTLDNAAATLPLTTGTNWLLKGGTIQGGSVDGGNGARLVATNEGGSLIGVTMNADLDLTGGSGTSIDITGGLTLNGTANLGAHAVLAFTGTQTLGGTGTLVLNNSTDSALALFGSAPILTIGSGFTIRGGSLQSDGGLVGLSENFGGALDGTIINHGTISADVADRSLTLNVSSVVNHGTIEAKNGGILSLTNLTSNSGTLRAFAGSTLSVSGDAWMNTGTLIETDGSLFLDGSFTTAGLGTLTLNGGSVYLAGTLDNTGATLTLDAAALWYLNGGTILGGTVAGSTLIAATTASVLDGVTLNSDLEVIGDSSSTAAVTIKSKLTLNGAATIGENAYLDFFGTQTLDGAGAVVFTDDEHSALTQSGAAPILTIASGMTIHGGSSQSSGGHIGSADYFPSASDGVILNQGNISADVNGMDLVLFTSKVVNEGTVEAKNGGGVSINHLVSNTATLSAAGTGHLLIAGDHWNNEGIITITDSTLTLGGVFTVPGLGTLTLSGAYVELTGLLENTGTTLVLNSGAAWTLVGGAINGGTVDGPAGAALILGEAFGTLYGVTMNADLQVRGSSAGMLAGAGIFDGLTLNGTATLDQFSSLNFYGKQTLGGTGSVLFLDAPGNSLSVMESGGRLTIGPSMTIHGGSAQNDGAQLGYSSILAGPTDFTLVNLGRISADLDQTDINILDGRFINAGTLEELNGGHINAPALVATELKTLTGKSLPYAFLDADGTPVKVKWTGAGLLTFVRFLGTGGKGDLFSVSTAGSDLTSSLSITTTGVGASTSVDTIDIHGSLKSLTAPTTDLLGDVTSTNSVGALTLRNAVSGSTVNLGPRATGDTKTMTSLTFDLVAELQLTSATPLLALTAAQWLDRDGTPDVITAPSLGTLTIKAAAARGLASDFEAGMNLSGVGVAPKALTLGKATVAGNIADSDWDVFGNVGAITAGSTGFDWCGHFSGSLVSLTVKGATSGDILIGPRAAGTLTAVTFTLDDVAELTIDSGTPIKSITAVQWLDGDGLDDFINAPSLGTLTIKGSATRMMPGDFEADVTLSGLGVPVKSAVLGRATVAGQLTGGHWAVNGLTTAIKAGSFAADWTGNFGGPVGSLTTTGEASGAIIIGARAAGDLTSKTILNFDTVSELSLSTSTPISSLTTRSWSDQDGISDVIVAPSIGALTVKGDTRVSRPLTGDFQADLTLTGAGLAATAKTLGAVTVKGTLSEAAWNVTGAAGAITAGSTAQDWSAVISGAISAVTAGTLQGTLQADSIGAIKADRLDHLTLTLGAGTPTAKALGSLTVKHAIDTSDLRVAGNIGTITAEEILHSTLFAGVQPGVTFLPQTRADFLSTVATIGKLVVTGKASSTDPGLVDSYIAAHKITTASITRFAPNNGGQAYGLAAESIATLTLKNASGTTTVTNVNTVTADATAAGDDFFVKIL
jgi:hypothetical protein